MCSSESMHQNNLRKNKRKIIRKINKVFSGWWEVERKWKDPDTWLIQAVVKASSLKGSSRKKAWSSSESVFFCLGSFWSLTLGLSLTDSFSFHCVDTVAAKWEVVVGSWDFGWLVTDSSLFVVENYQHDAPLSSSSALVCLAPWPIFMGLLTTTWNFC